MTNDLLPNALIYLSAAVIAVPLAKKLGLGSVLGYLMAGVAIGPWGLRLISGVEDILHFSEFGVVLLLFLIGLELEPRRLWSLRRSIFGWGSAQVGFVALGLFLAGLGLGIDWKTALIGALGLSLSSTAIALATLSERHLMATAAGSAGFSILLFQDIAAIPMIAIVPMLGSVTADGDANGWMTALKVIAVLALLVLASRYLMRPLFRLITKAGIREVFTAFALLLVIAIGLLMQSVGLSMALGTFLAGVLLADSEYRHALETDLEPFKGLLLGLFFIAVGMSIDFGVLVRQPLLVLGLVTGFLMIKGLVLYVLSKRFGILPGQQPFFAILLSQGGEFAFVIFGAAATARVFSEEVAATLLVVVALSMVTTPLLLVLHDKLIEPYFATDKKRPDDAFDGDMQPVIIAGFGRFGQIIGRLLHANRIGVTVLDHDPDQIDLLRRFGLKVYYGDATRIDLLRAAGAHKARALIVALDSVEDSIKLVDAVRGEFPELPILARARNVTHYYDLMDRGVTVIERETFESALQLGRRTLETLGFNAFQARQAAMKFRAHNLKTLHNVYPYYKDQEQMVSLAVQAREELEAMFARDAEINEERRGGEWERQNPNSSYANPKSNDTK
ncbi:glutathione-regulated potassium-efflux system protein KefC [Noviherbaspirillum aerium]|uniref:glutathione-regulated potassium-efflux system protein KefC n=1 Tax=Noviherbaspirillum aerium TaxID=2588497 RepID=UPI00124E62ED|nr:glutathione-regulated potassium-efflux system protein KefC [Noviherbaspirillum aerium]